MQFAIVAIGLLIGIVEGVFFHVAIAIATIILAMAATAALTVVLGDQLWFVAVTPVMIAIALQVGYLIGTLARVPIGAFLTWKNSTGVVFSPGPSSGTLNSLIQEHMEVVGSDGAHVGMVDHKEVDDRIVLAKDDPQAGGRAHVIGIDWVAYVDSKVHLKKPSRTAVLEWQVAA
jgi:hypothetical protein